MVKIKGPLMSKSASGQIGERLTFSERDSGSQARFQRAQKPALPTWAQADERSLYRLAYARWTSMLDAERAVFNNEAKQKGYQMSGWNLFLKYALASPKNYLGLVGYWSFNCAGIGTVSDLSKNLNTGTLKPTWPNNSPQYITSKNCKLFKALSFDGVDDYIDCGNSSVLNFGLSVDFSVSCLVKFTSSASRFICGKHFNKIGYYIYISGGKYRLTIRDAVKNNVVFTNKAVNDGKWHQVACTIDRDGYIKQYVDGLLDMTPEVCPSINVDNGYPFYIGRRDLEVGYNFPGAIDDLKIYNRVLPASEIKTLYNLYY